MQWVTKKLGETFRQGVFGTRGVGLLDETLTPPRGDVMSWCHGVTQADAF